MSSPLSAPSAEQISIRHELNQKYSHPLDMIPFFRRFKKSWWRGLIYTFLFSSALALFFILVPVMFSGHFPDANTLLTSLFVSNCIGYTFHVLFLFTGNTVEPWILRHNRIVITLYYSLASILCVLFGFTIAGLVLGWPIGAWLFSRAWLTAVLINSLIISTILGAIFFVGERRALAEAALEREHTRVAEIEREATLANLRALQAQIEPHFLFNTLANVVGLIHSQPETAKHMLEKFIAYLRASLAGTRERDTTLGAEFELMTHFLAILKVRMGERLAVEFDLPADLAALRLPPMLLQPLVENAIKHGLEQKVEGGKITLRAQRAEAMVKISVIDTGLGFSGATSSGIGLKNVRERLDMLFPGQGALSIEENQPYGTRVILTIPHGIVAAKSSIEVPSGAFSACEARRL